MAVGQVAPEDIAVNSELVVSIKGHAGAFSLSADFDSSQGIAGVFGHSGSGKTTLLKMIAGLVRPDAGKIMLGERILFDAGAGIDVPASQRRTGFVFQDGRLFPHMSVRNNLVYAQRFGRRDNRRALGDVTGLLGLDQLLDRKPFTLSGGERQRVAIGRALLADPDLLLMDEPLSSLDHARRQEVLPYLERVREETAVPIIYVSHEIDEIARLADTLVVLSQGAVIASGPTVEVFGRIDLGPALGRYEAGAMVDGKVAAIDEAFGLATVIVGGEKFELVAHGLEVGNSVRMRIRARDVAVASTRPTGISIRNCISATVDQINRETGAYGELLLTVGDQALRARITRKSLVELNISKGSKVFALLKAVSVERRALASGDGTVARVPDKT